MIYMSKILNLELTKAVYIMVNKVKSGESAPIISVTRKGGPHITVRKV